MNERKTFYELTVEDMRRCPVWVATTRDGSDDEYDSGPGYVRPVSTLAEVPENWVYFLPGEVILSDRTEFKAAIEFPVREGGRIESFMLLNSDRLPCWFRFPSKSIDEVTLRVLQKSLQRPLDMIFPITLVSEIPEIHFSFRHVIELIRY